MKPHKWAKEIKAWADGAEIEIFDIRTGNWETEQNPKFYENVYGLQYRIKPQPKEPQYLYVFKSLDGYTDCSLTPAVNTGWIYVGKIKLEQDDE